MISTITIISLFAICAADRYVVNPSYMTWYNARDYCASIDSSLATIKSETERDEAWSYLNNNINYPVWAWIGLNKLSGSWRWIDDTSCSYAPSSDCYYDPRWNTGEPTEGHESCAYIGLYDGTGKYNDNPCTVTAPVLCNIPAGAIFGLRVGHQTYAQSGASVTMTFYWGTSMNQCTVIPNQKRVTYTCDSRSSSTSECATSTSKYGLEISNPSTDDVMVEGLDITINGVRKTPDVRAEWVGDNGYYYRYYDLRGPDISNVPGSVTGTQQSSIPVCAGKLSICVQNVGGGETTTGTIEARLWYLESGSYVFTEWATLGSVFGATNKGKCIEFVQFSDYADKDWYYIDLHTCSNDGLAIDSIIYWDVSTQTYHTRTDFKGSSCVKTGYFWLDGNFQKCHAVSVDLSSGHVYMNPEWVSGQNCQAFEAKNNPASLIDEQNLFGSMNGNIKIFGMILGSLVVISTFCNVYYFCCNKGHKTVSAWSDTDQ